MARAPLSSIVELWNSVWGVLGPAIIAALILYIRHPEKFEKMIVHVARFLSLFSGEFEKKAVAREVSYIVSSEFAKSYPNRGGPESPRRVGGGG